MRRPLGVVRRQLRAHLLEDLGVVRARLVEPEHGGRAGRARALTASRTQSSTGAVLRLAGAPDVARLDVVPEQLAPGGVDDPHAARPRDLERLVVRAVLLGLLRHQADVRRGAHGRRVERAVLPAEVDRLRVQRGVAGVGDHGLGVLLLAVGVPHLAGRADHRRHRRVDDDVARHVQVGDARGRSRPSPGAGRTSRRPRSPPRSPPARPRAASRARSRCSPRPLFGLAPTDARSSAKLGEHVGEVGPHGVAEDDRVRDLHHRRLQVHGEQHALLVGLGDLLLEERVQRPPAHHGAVDDLALLHRQRRHQHRRRRRRRRRTRCAARPPRPSSPSARWSGSRRRPSSTRASWSRPTSRPSSAGACARTPSPTRARGGPSCPRAARG